MSPGLGKSLTRSKKIRARCNRTGCRKKSGPHAILQEKFSGKILQKIRYGKIKRSFSFDPCIRQEITMPRTLVLYQTPSPLAMAKRMTITMVRPG
jgi:hypothetical protein